MNHQNTNFVTELIFSCHSPLFILHCAPFQPQIKYLGLQLMSFLCTEAPIKRFDPQTSHY
ncbi:hypothetical protein I7I50_04751 [Histoplasma capsulatum G186AR]|uniref:Uncharacterized protein n=1 Tax=Ajellomyces capsulatus TaxID=5037 RepID=A0A8H7YR36_AJECA|nr:hypothetical protein I7I52_05660 [Histoplasma capsulatum]QSS75573.1 hypothetical protein I7I50_04751 [Histoplasma capsulatum G186AR]